MLRLVLALMGTRRWRRPVPDLIGDLRRRRRAPIIANVRTWKP